MNCEQVDVEGQLSAYLDDQLTTSCRLLVAEHLNTCSQCRALLDDYHHNDMLLAQLPHIEAPATLRAAIFSSSRYQHLTSHSATITNQSLLLTILAALLLSIGGIIGLRLLRSHTDALPNKRL